MKVEIWHTDCSKMVGTLSVFSYTEASEQINLCVRLSNHEVDESVTIWFE